MGIGMAASVLLIRELQDRPLHLSGSVLTFGRQNTYVTSRDLHEIAASLEFPLCSDLPQPPEIDPRTGYLTDKAFFSLLGFTKMISLDNASIVECDVHHDLNNPDLPEDLRGAFEWVFDGGTLEHVFHVPHVFLNIFQALSVGGRIVHQSPSSNYMDHGFYMFSPTLFQDFYTANQWNIETITVVRHSLDPRAPWELLPYVPGCLDNALGALPEGMWAIHCVATKTASSTGDVIPQQGFYTTFNKVHEGLSTP
jgi:hypothetical protein